MKPFEIISEQEEYRDGERFSIIRAQINLPDGKEAKWAYVKQKDAVVVVALRGDFICIEKQWRLGRNDFVWELPSGWIEKEQYSHEDILNQAKQELKEESGLSGEKAEILGNFYLSNHGTTKFYVVLVSDLEEGEHKREEFEFLETEFVHIDDAYKRLLIDQIPTAQVQIAMSLLEKYLYKKKHGID